MEYSRILLELGKVINEINLSYENISQSENPRFCCGGEMRLMWFDFGHTLPNYFLQLPRFGVECVIRFFFSSFVSRIIPVA